MSRARDADREYERAMPKDGRGSLMQVQTGAKEIGIHAQANEQGRPIQFAPLHRTKDTAVVNTIMQVVTYTGAQGVPLVADVGGDPNAPPVILMHGGGQTRHSWGAAQKVLVGQGFHVINIDARGHGDSGWSPDGNYRLPILAEDLHNVIATLPSPPALVGASMGGATSLYAVGNSPTLIAAGMALVDILPSMEEEGRRKIGDFMRANSDGFANLDEAADAVASYNPHRPRPQDPKGLMKNLRLRTDGRMYWHWDPAFVTNTVSKEASELPELLVAACAGVRIPTMLVRGMESDIVGDTGVEELQRLIPHVQIFNVSGAGHMVAGDRNDAFNSAVIAFLRRLPGFTIADHL